MVITEGSSGCLILYKGLIPLKPQSPDYRGVTFMKICALKIYMQYPNIAHIYVFMFNHVFIVYAVNILHLGDLCFTNSNTALLPTGSEEREVLGVGSIPVAILPSCQNMKTVAL